MLISLSGWAGQRDMPLVDLISALQRQGYTILYSDRLVPTGQWVTVETIDLPALASTLEELGLQLREEEGVWVVTRGDEPSPGEPVPDSPAAHDMRLETVIVTGTVHRFPGAGAASSNWSFSADDMSLLPSLASDALRATLHLPGVSSIGVSAKPRIRGGLQDELLVMQDGVELLEPFHLADYHSAYSSIDYHTIESLDVYTGGFPSRYGNRMSGVMDIRNQWRDDEYDTDIGVSSFSTFIHTRGEIDGTRPGRWLLSLRQGDLSDLTGYIDTRSGDPEYRDASGRMSIALSPALDLAFGAVYGQDDILFEDEEERASSRIDTAYAWTSLDWQPGPPLRSRLTLSLLDFTRKKALGSFEDESKGGLLDHRQEVQRLALRNDWSALRGATFLEFGWQAEYNQGDYRHVSRIDRGELADILGTERLVERDIDERPDGWSGGAYLQAEWELAGGLAVQPSLRWDVQDYYLQRDLQQQLSPRLGLAWTLDDALRARLSVGRFHQPEGIQELQVLDGVTRFFSPQYSDQAVAGLEWQRGDLELVGEFYYKRYRDQKGRFENIFNPFVLLPEMEPDRVELEPDKAFVRGFDLDIRFVPTTSLGGHLRYSYMDARDRLDGQWVERRWSQSHTVNAGLTWRSGGLSLSAATTWHSGWRSSLLPAFVAEETVVPVASVLNNTELRDYFSLDVGARYAWVAGRVRLELYADISNLTDRANEAGIDFDVEEVEGGYDILPDTEAVLGRVTSVGITLSF